MSNHVYTIRIARLITVLLIVVLSLTSIPSSAFAQIADAERTKLEQELARLEKEIAEQETILAGQKTKSATLQNDIAKLRTEISAAKSKIKARDLEISKLGKEITTKVGEITTLQTSIERGRSSLGELIRKTNEQDKLSFSQLLLSKKKLSDFYTDIEQVSSVRESLHATVLEIQGKKVDTELVKENLQQKRNEEIDKKKEIERQKQIVEQSEKQQNQLLAISKNQEKAYEQVLVARRAEAAKIRSALFELRGTNGIPFGEAYDLAKVAGQRTGVRPAFILAILKQESNLGKNVGTCNRPGDARTWKDIMPGPDDNSWRDDQAAYLRIVKSLGISPEGQPLSCPLAWGGWGGAMGPSQFIPVTWESYASRIQSVTGAKVANPWNPEHAITATALYVKDLGAAAQTYTAEREAACKYYSGRGCSDPKVKNAFYGDGVMKHVADIQKNIDLLESL